MACRANTSLRSQIRCSSLRATGLTILVYSWLQQAVSNVSCGNLQQLCVYIVYDCIILYHCIFYDVMRQAGQRTVDSFLLLPQQQPTEVCDLLLLVVPNAVRNSSTAMQETHQTLHGRKSVASVDKH